MQWWHWILIVIGVGLLGWVKLTVFKKMKENKVAKNKFIDEE